LTDTRRRSGGDDHEEKIMLSRRKLIFAASAVAAVTLAPRLTFAEAATATTLTAVGPFTLEPCLITRMRLNHS